MRRPSEAELSNICSAMANYYGCRFYNNLNDWHSAGASDYLIVAGDIVIVDEFISDGPGFLGSLAWVQFSGGPENFCMLNKPTKQAHGVHGWTWFVTEQEK